MRTIIKVIGFAIALFGIINVFIILVDNNILDEGKLNIWVGIMVAGTVLYMLVFVADKFQPEEKPSDYVDAYTPMELNRELMRKRQLMQDSDDLAVQQDQ